MCPLHCRDLHATEGLPMKHASAMALDQLEDLLERIRQEGALREKKRGVFYLKSSAFLHFHESPDGLFADVRVGAEWDRLPVNTRTQRQALLTRVRAWLEK